MEELSYFNKHVWELADAQRALQDHGSKSIRTRWVITNKGDAANPDVRARLDAQEMAQYDDASFFAATPPLESKRMLFLSMGVRTKA